MLFNSRIISKCLLAVGVVFACAAETNAQKWYSPTKGYNLQNQAWKEEIGKKYQRIPARLQEKVSTNVWNLSQYSAGLSVRFKTNAREILVDFLLKETPRNFDNMTAYCSSGVDLYAIAANGDYHWVATHGLATFSGTNRFTFSNLHPEAITDEEDCEYELYLPLFNTLTNLIIGVNKQCNFEFVPAKEEQPIVVYGTSIAHGASASRPGLAWTNALSRELKMPVVNLGFAGSALMEPDFFDVLAEIDAKVFVIDAIPNIKIFPTFIVERTMYGVKRLREVSNAPILLVESIGTADKLVRPEENAYDDKGDALLREAYEKLLEENVGNLYYLTREEIGPTEESQVDGAHPNDVGMKQYTDAYAKKLREILANTDGVASKTVSNQNSSTSLYQLNGMQVSEDAEKNLPRGIYIQDGKKIQK